jgi:arylsulfatase A
MVLLAVSFAKGVRVCKLYRVQLRKPKNDRGQEIPGIANHIINQSPNQIKMNIKISLSIVLLLLTNVFYAQARPERPNFIIIFADDLGYGDLSCYGHPTILTPSLDKMAYEGMRFTQFYVGASVCSPSRAALLTGRLAMRTGIYGTRDPTGNRGVVFLQNSLGGLPLSEITIAEVLKDQGYATGIIGKWHLGHMPVYLPVNQGFDYWFGNDHHQNNPGIITTTPSGNDIQREVAPEPKTRPWCSLYLNDSEIEENPEMLYFTQRFTEAAVNFVKKNSDKPFLLYYATNSPHVPLYAIPDFAGKSLRGLYGDVVEELDWSVGEILETLKDLNIDQNTLVLFISDNGPWLTRGQRGGSAGLLYEGKNSTYEGGMRVPAIAWWPGQVPANSVSTSIATTMDILPTIVNLSGAEIPIDRVLDGVDITDVLFNKKDNVRDIVYYYINANLYALRKGPWKAHFITHASYSIETPVTHEVPLLYNIEIDPSEKYNLANRYPNIIEDLRKEYERQKLIEPAPSEIDKISNQY